jgi:hypothetical protein
MKRLNVVCFNAEGEELFDICAGHVDICDSYTVIYSNTYKESQTEKEIIRFTKSLSSVNVVIGTITAYFIDNSYLVITTPQSK